MIFEHILEIIQKGLKMTVLVSVFSWFLTILLGIGMGIIGDFKSRWIRETQYFVSVLLRGFPELIALYVLYFGLSGYLNISAFIASILALGIVQSGFFAEATRAAFMLIPVSQRRASRCFGFSGIQTYMLILLPQTLKALIPPALNAFLALMKLSTYTAAVGVAEMLYINKTISAREHEVASVSVATALIFILISITLSQIISAIQNKRSRLTMDTSSYFV